jgi:hypothetical protein
MSAIGQLNEALRLISWARENLEKAIQATVECESELEKNKVT